MSFRLWIPLAMAGTLFACGSEMTGTAQEARLQVAGHVRSSVNNASIAGARVELWFAAFGQPSRMLRATDTDVSGAFALEIGPPPGYAFPNCSTLHLEVSASGFVLAPLVGIGAYDSPECRAGAVTVMILLAPLP